MPQISTQVYIAILSTAQRTKVPKIKNSIKITVHNGTGNNRNKSIRILRPTKYYGDMPEAVFNALEAAFISGAETAIVPKTAFEMMLMSFENGRKEA